MNLALNDLTLLYAALLSKSDDDPSKANEPNPCGDQFLEYFRTTGHNEDIDRAIVAYEQAAACLSPDDARLAGFLNDFGLGYVERYDSFGGRQSPR